MTDSTLLPELIARTAARSPEAVALSHGAQSMNYAQLYEAVDSCVGGLRGLGLQRGERVAIYLEKRCETVIASFAAPAAGCVFVPLNPLLKAEQVAYILRDCNVRALITSSDRLPLLAPVLESCHDLRHVVLTGARPETLPGGPLAHLAWDDLLAAPAAAGHRVIDTDMAAILYTSGSTGKPKGVVLSHRNMVAGAKSVAGYLQNGPDDTLLAALLASVPEGERIVVAEDSAELHVTHPHVVYLEGRPPNVEGAGAVSLRDLVRQSLRMRPDRLIVGEVRGAEVLDLLNALNTGHSGGAATVHANSAADALVRLELLALQAGMGREAAQIAIRTAFRCVVHIERGNDGRRRVREIANIDRESGQVPVA